MNFRTIGAPIAAILTTLALLAAACGGDSDGTAVEPSPASSPPVEADQPLAPPAAEPTEEATAQPVEPEAAPDPLPSLQEPPYTVEFGWGEFTLDDDIANRLFVGDDLTFVLSISDRPAGDSQNLERGWRLGVEEVSSSGGYGVAARVVGPAGTDSEARASDLEELVQAGGADCLVVDSAGGASVADAIDAAISAGVPVFTIGTDSPFTRRFAYYGIDDLEAGKLAASFVGQWATEGRLLLLNAGVLARDPGDPSAKARMEGFIESFLELMPHVEFANGPEDVEPLGFDSDSAYDSAAVWLQEHPDVDIIFLADGGLEQLAAAIGDQFLHGDVYAAGFGMSDAIGNFIHDGVVVATLLEGLESQAETAAQACGRFLDDGVYDAGAVARNPQVVHEDNLESTGWAPPERN